MKTDGTLCDRLTPGKFDLETVAFALVNSEFDEVLPFRVNKEKQVIIASIPAQRDGFQIWIGCLLSRIVSGLTASDNNDRIRPVGLGGQIHRTVAPDTVVNECRAPRMKGQVNRIELFAGIRNRFVQITAQRRCSDAFKESKRHSREFCNPTEKRCTDFHGLLLSLREFCLGPLFSHALEKALYPNYCFR